MKNSFVTYLGTDDFLPGVLTLHESLKTYNFKYHLIVLITKSVSNKNVELLKNKKIKIKKINEIRNPQELSNDERGFRYMYTKLRIFQMFDYHKIVYLDSDMLVCANIEALFDSPHMSAVIAGALHPVNVCWKELNAGLLVIEPNKNTFNQIISLLNKIPSNDGSDQGFLHSFYKDWPANSQLHLEHKYNVPSIYLDKYCESNHYHFLYIRKVLTTNIAILHFWGKYKPWQINRKLLKRKSKSKFDQSLILWWDIFLNSINNL